MMTSNMSLPSGMVGLKWSPFDGPVKFVYQGKQKGSQCAWSVKWQTAAGQIRPRDWIATEDMIGAQLKWEISDLLARTHLHNHINQHEMQLFRDFDPDNIQHCTNARDILRRLRTVYPEAVYQPNPPVAIVRMVTRPGW